MENSTPEVADTNLSVAEVIEKNLVKQEDGSYAGIIDGKPVKLGEALKALNLNEDKIAAVTAETRRRSTESSFTKERQRNIDLAAELEVFKSLVPSNLDITPEKQEELEVLKYQDPDKWFDEMSALKQASKAKFQETTEQAIQEAKQKARMEDTVASRAAQLDEFNASVETPLTDEQIQFDIPPRLLKRVESGDLSFRDMLVLAHDFINSPKVVGQPEYTPEPSFEDTPGRNAPAPGTVNKVAKTYETTKF